MDFQFENGTGPMDARSPFAQLQPNARRIPNSVNMTPRKSEYRPAAFHTTAKLTVAAQGTQGGFDSPSKGRTTGTPFFSPSPTKPLPAIPPWNSHFTTPRKSKDEFDDSSAGGDTPKSPEPRDDSEITPEIKHSRSTAARFDSASAPTVPGAERERSSPSKSRPMARREGSLMAMALKVKNKIYSPGRGELHKPEHVGAIEKATRRRKRDVDRRVARKRRHTMSDSGEDTEPPRPSRKEKEEKKPHWAGSLFSFIAEHPSLPQTLSYYAQFIFNIFLLLCCGYLIYCFWSAVLGDVQTKQDEASAEVMAQMAQCARDYQENRCDPATRMNALEQYCNEKERCLKRDPRKVGRAKVSAHTFAEIFNSFVEPISYKAMLFTLVMIFGCFGLSNFVCRFTRKAPTPEESTDESEQAFVFFRNKASQWQQPNYGYGYGYGPPPPPTPQRSFSNQDRSFYAGTPWHQPLPGMGFEPAPSGGYGQIEGQGSPQRRLVYN